MNTLWAGLASLTLMGCSSSVLIERDDPTTWWEEQGWTRLTPALPLPSSVRGEHVVDVWVYLPPGEVLRTATLSDGRIGLVFPPGSEADRVEWRGEGDHRRVVDVRGTRLLADGQREHHVFLPRGADPHAPLVGTAWRAGDLEANRRHLDALVEEVRPHRAAPAAWESSYRSKHHCESCHRAERPDNGRPRDHGLVNRGTDQHGWFTPSTLLAASVPGEAYGAWQPQRSDPHLQPSCAEARHGSLCADRTVPRWTLDVSAALVAGDVAAHAHCDSVRWVLEHLEADDPGRPALQAHACVSDPFESPPAHEPSPTTHRSAP